MKLSRSDALLYAAICVYALSMLLVHIDVQGDLRWYSLAIWLAAVLLAALWGMRGSGVKEIFGPSPSPRELWLLLPLALLTIALNFAFIEIYPFTWVVDGLRDGGLNARQIVEGQSRNLFGFGRYESHGLIIPTYNAIFYLLFGDSPLSWRVPGAVLGTLDGGLVYLLARRFIGPASALWAALFLVTLPLHIFYSRCQTVVIFNSFWMMVLMFVMVRFLKERSLASAALLGVTLGFVCGFHASARTVCLALLILALLKLIADLLRRRAPMASIVTKIFLMMIMLLVGYGPRLQFTSMGTFFKTDRLKSFSFASPDTNTGALLLELATRYQKSLRVFVDQPTMSHFPTHLPIFQSSVLAALFLIGVVAALRRIKEPFFLILFFAGLLLPITNSVLTDYLNNDHRLAPLFPIAALFAAIGVDQIINLIGYKTLMRSGCCALVMLVVLGASLRQAYAFFDEGQATADAQPVALTTPYIIQVIKQSPHLLVAEALCISTSGKVAEHLGLMHIAETFSFYLPHKKIKVQLNPLAGPYEIFIARSCAAVPSRETWERKVFCSRPQQFACPGVSQEWAGIGIFVEPLKLAE